MTNRSGIRWLQQVMLLTLVLGGCGEAERRAPPTAGNPAPQYAAPTLSGDTLALADLQGQAVLLNIWATWCPPCREEMPALEALHRDMADEGLRVVAVSVDSRSAAGDVRQFLDEYGITFTVLHDPDEQVSRTFRTTGVPETYLIDRDGTIVKRWIGKIDAASEAVRGPVREALGAAQSGS
jgi:cytochrome c biogenesis protein CcmG/thiol:disulfide interchange protein DsbE